MAKAEPNPPAQPQPETPPAAPEAPPATPSADDEISAVLQFDPFGEEGTDAPETPETPEAPPGTPPSEEAPETPPASPETPEQPQTPEGGQDRIARLLETQTGLLAHLAQGGQQPQPDQPQTPDVPDYNYTIPPELTAAIGSDDPGERGQAIGLLAKGLAQGIHRTVMTEVREQMLGEAIPQMIQGAMSQQAQSQTVFQDFYGAYPEFNNPALYPAVQQIGAQIMQETGIQQWTPQLRDAIATRLRQVLGNQQAPTPTPAPTPEPVYTPGGPARPAATPVKNEEADVQDTLFGTDT